MLVMSLEMLVLAGAIAVSPAPLHVDVGVATYYAPGVMERVIANRQRWGQDLGWERDVVGYVAVWDCGLLGSLAWITWIRDRVLEGPFLVVDCADPRDYGHLLRIGFAVDVDWATAHRRGMVAPEPVVVVVDR